MTHDADRNASDVIERGVYYDHCTGDGGEDSGHTTSRGRVYGILPIRYDACDRYGCKRLVVIDPEDRAQVEQLASEYAVIGRMIDPGSPDRADYLQAALRALIAAPKPEEPEGLGAVVEDAEGRRYVRGPMAAGDLHWNYIADDHMPRCAKWRAVPAVRVLSEGVR